MTDETDQLVDPSRPDSAFHLHGVDHITLEGSNIDATIEYYRDILGCPLVLSQPNLDRRELTHLFFDPGDGRLISFFASDERETVDLDRPDPGQVHHLAFRIDGTQLEEIAAALEAEGYPVSEYDRGVFHSLYTEDPNGLTIELVADKFAVPADRRGEVVARAHHKRLEAGADFVDAEHMRAALAELDIDVEEHRIRAAPRGRDY